MEFNKIAGAGLGALLVFLLLNFFSGKIYGTGESLPGTQEGEGQVLAYALAVQPQGGGGQEAEQPQVDLVALFSQPDVAAGEKVFRACSACHSAEAGVNKVGPSLHNVVGRPVASISDFSYSDAMKAKGGDWTPEAMFHFLKDPRGEVPGTKMTFAGLPKPEDRVNVIAYLNQQGDNPVDLTAGLPQPQVAEANSTGETGGAIPEPALSPGVGPKPGVNPPGEAAGGASAAQGTGQQSGGGAAGGAPAAQGTTQQSGGGAAGGAPAAEESAGMQAGSEAASMQQSAPATVTGTTTVQPNAEDLEVQRTTPPQLEQQKPGPATAQSLPKALTPGETRADKRAEPMLEPQPTPTPPSQLPAVEGGTQGSAAPAEPAQQMAAAPAAPAAGGTPATSGIDFASGDPKAGEQIFRRCGACHKIEEGKNAIGPSLWGVVDRPVASVPGYNYSDAMKAHGGEWTPDRLFTYLENPKGVVPGTKMAFAGLKKPQDRIDVITYLNEADGTPVPLK